MVLNDFREDCNTLFRKEGVTKLSISEKMGVPNQNISKYMNKASITQRYVDLCEALGYDIKVEYIKREG